LVVLCYAQFNTINLSCLFCRLAIDTMQSVCLDEFGGEKAVEPASQETTIIQHIFGGRLQSQVMDPVILKLFDFVLVCESFFSQHALTVLNSTFMPLSRASHPFLCY